MCCTSGVDGNLAAVTVVVEIVGLPAVTGTVPVADLSPVVASPSPPATSNKSSSIGPIAGGIAGGVVLIGQQSAPVCVKFACICTISLCVCCVRQSKLLHRHAFALHCPAVESCSAGGCCQQCLGPSPTLAPHKEPSPCVEKMLCLSSAYVPQARFILRCSMQSVHLPTCCQCLVVSAAALLILCYGLVAGGGAALALFLRKRRNRRRQWTKDLEVAKASYGEDGTSNSGDSGSSDGSTRPGGLGRKVAAYMPFGTNSNESVDATPHAKHARMDDGFAGISRFKPDGTLKVGPPRQPNLIPTAAAAAAAPGQMGTILERKTFSAPAAPAAAANLHDTANLMDSHSNVQTAAEHAALSPTSLFSFGTPIGRNSDPFRTPGLPSRQSDGRLSSEGSTNLLLRGGSGDQLLAVQASGEYSDRFQELEPMGGRKSSRQYSGNVDANLWSVSACFGVLCCQSDLHCQCGHGIGTWDFPVCWLLCMYLA